MIIREAICGTALCVALLLGSVGCITLPINDSGEIALPPSIEKVVTEGWKWIDGSITTTTGGSLGILALTYLGRLLLKSRKKSSILLASMDDGSIARAKELAKHTSVEKELT